MRLCLIILLTICFLGSNAQSINNVKASFNEGRVIVTYDLVGGSLNQKYALELYGSHDNFSKPLTKVTGDVGKNVTPGILKRIIWEATLEFTSYKKDISFKVKGEPMIAPFTFKNPTGSKALKRGKKTSIEWSGGANSQKIKLELYKGTELASLITETENSGQYIWNIPVKLGKGSYSIKISTSGESSASESASSKTFTIKPKIPLVYKILPAVVVGGIIAILSSGKEGSSNELPVAPEPNGG